MKDKKTQYNIYEILVIVIFVSVMFIGGMYVWGLVR